MELAVDKHLPCHHHGFLRSKRNVNLTNINTLGILVLMCPIILCIHSLQWQMLWLLVYSVGNYLSCVSDHLPLHNYFGTCYTKCGTWNDYCGMCVSLGLLVIVV